MCTTTMSGETIIHSSVVEKSNCSSISSLDDSNAVLRGGRVVRRCWVNFQCRGVLLTWITVGQGPIGLAVGAGGGCLDIFSLVYQFSFLSPSGWSGGTKVLGKFSVPGRPTYLDYSRAMAYCACRRCGWGLFGHFLSRLSVLFFLPLLGRRPDIDCNIVSKGR